ncbi:MAG: hypothetical protein LBT60_06555, partial [Oscillospiraceae bacterium]|nr:hypothetical protein [Oscillospiraceae bacterium]
EPGATPLPPPAVSLAPEPTPTPTPPPNAVYTIRGGSQEYHRKRCSRLANRLTQAWTLEDVKAAGYTPCLYCAPPK